MAQPRHPSHLPKPLRDPAAYERLYEANSGVDDFLHHEYEPWREIRIPPNTSRSDVYHRLPAAPDFEYGGYLTKTRIRYQACEPTGASTIESKPCVFHSHPTKHPGADIPSFSDIYSFLKYRNLRAITVGSTWIWVWNKTPSVLRTVRRLFAWETERMVPEMLRLMKEPSKDIAHRYKSLALSASGLKWPQNRYDQPEEWRELLRDTLGITTTLIRRDVG